MKYKDKEGVGAEIKFRLIPANELTFKPKLIVWTIKNLIEAESINLMFGPPASGKSLFALDWAFCMAAGLDWESRQTQHAGAVIIAGEGHAGYARRLKALEKKYSITAPDNLLLSEQSAQLDDKSSCDDIVKAIQQSGINPGLIVIDTLNRNFVGEENSSKDIAAFIQNLDHFFKPLKMTTVIIHHSGHAESGRGRGSSAIRAGMDAEYSVAKDENAITLICTKAKDFEPPQPLEFTLKQVCLNWVDDELKPLTSVYLECNVGAVKQPKKAKLNARERQILDSLTDALNEHGIEPTDEIKAKFSGFGTGTFAKVVAVEQWREFAYKVIPNDTEQRKVLTRARNKFLSAGIITEYDGYIWRIDTGTAGQKPFVKAADEATEEIPTGQAGTKAEETLQATDNAAYSTAGQAGQSGTNDEVSRGLPGRDGTHLYISVPAVPPPTPEDQRSKDPGQESDPDSTLDPDSLPDQDEIPSHGESTDSTPETDSLSGWDDEFMAWADSDVDPDIDEGEF
ncbi:hypothetical protein METHB2_790009 [Candidatus Methylobacter favarea]|uniref:AAA family ATPase n=1 Tax=Candidatus Methylobacter favarea TaxID=2707345 RepID=A0A8S0WCP6_9GAMM|nr:AAA family ATPase [Candidatus Methylobacter favarea]CAA9892675.1 hypothetical protein METHB2_790009 [Candidatus Methylobacter favarea]